LRNRLEEADDALDEASTRAEDIDVLQAAGESKIVLNRLDRAIQRQQHSSTRTTFAEEDATTDLLNDIDDVTRRLCSALETLEFMNGSIGLALNDASHSDRSSTQTPMSPSSMTTNSEDGNLLSTGSSAWSLTSKRTSLSQRLSVNSESAQSRDCRPEEEKQVASSRVMAGPPLTSVDGFRALSSMHPDRFSSQFAYFDPMSVDIDSASSLILGRRPSPNPPALMPRSPARMGSPSVTSPSLPPDTAAKLGLDKPTRDANSYISRSASLRGASLPVRAGRDGRLSSSASLRSSPTTPTSAQANRQSRAGATQHMVTPARNTGTGLEAPIQEQVRTSTYRAADSILYDLNSLEHSSHPLARRTTRIRDRILSRSAQAAKSRYRIVNPEKDDLNRTDSARFTGSPASLSLPSSPSSPSSPADSGRRAFAGFTPSLYKIESLPGSRDTDDGHDYSGSADSELDNEIINAIVSSWNAGQWDQAKHNMEILASRHLEHSDGRLTRRLEHLLGVLASINGQLEVALAHFLAVYSVAIDNVCQLDVGHCAAACWMGDIYALHKRKTEAVLAYSVAAKTPLAENPIWLPLQQQIVTERDACRSGDVKTGINISVDNESRDEDKMADTILDPRVIGRSVARTIMQADNQTASREIGKLDLNRSRAMALQDLGMQSGPLHENRNLEIDATAFEPSQSWPLPFDPFFVLENVRRHRLSTPESDLLRSGLSAAKIPKKSRLAFSCQDLRWLIVTLRSCLTRLKIEWSEVLIDHGPKFLARYKVAGTGMATNQFFTIPIYRLSFRPGYGVEMCPDGIFSSRIESAEAKADKGINVEEAKKVKKMIKEALETAAKRQDATESKSMTLPVMSINGVTSLHRK
jgi:hypothetical protein